MNAAIQELTRELAAIEMELNALDSDSRLTSRLLNSLMGWIQPHWHYLRYWTVPPWTHLISRLTLLPKDTPRDPSKTEFTSATGYYSQIPLFIGDEASTRIFAQGVAYTRISLRE
jgi:hypothetical protein